MKFIHEYDKHGNHRLILVENGQEVKSDWATHQDMAYLDMIYFVCFVATRYYENTVFKPDMVYMLNEPGEAEIINGAINAK